MWNLMHVMQVITYYRIMVEWPANANMMLLSMHNAITLENLINDFNDWAFTNLEEQYDEASTVARLE